MNPHALEGTSLYVHVPFCRQLCPYCDFAVAVRSDPPYEDYCDALIDELEARARELDGPPATIYFGGGTPAMFPPAPLRRFLSAIDRSRSAEMTIEANPHDITNDRLEVWHDLGFDRVSLGVQSFDDGALRGLGRDHDGDAALRAAAMLVGDARFRVSIDLIYGGPSYDPTVLAADLDVVADLQPQHVSAYELTIEPDTVFGRKHRKGELPLPAEDHVVDLGLELVDQLGALGYERYEVSSFGRDHDRALHNSGYWLGRPYLGLGMGAHSMRIDGGGVVRRANVRSLRAYVAEPTIPADVERVDARDALGERLMLAVRSRLGVSQEDLPLGEMSNVIRGVWDRLASRGLLEPGEVLRPTLAGLDVADAIAQQFWDATHPRAESS